MFVLAKRLELLSCYRMKTNMLSAVEQLFLNCKPGIVLAV